MATGSNSEQLGWVSCDVSALAGKKARIVITDRATGPWGHLLADHIVQSDKKAEDWK